MKAKSSRCYFGSAPVGTNAVAGEVAFVDPGQRDYTLLAGSAMIDAGSAYDPMGPFDLVGKARVSGEAADLGCHEYDQAGASCGFSADKVTLFEGGSAVLSSVVFGAPAGAQLTCSWTLKNTVSKTEKPLMGAKPTATFDDAGDYDITLTVTDGADFTATATRAAYVRVVPAKMYVAPAGQSTPAFPWKTPGTAASDLNEVVAMAIDGAVVELLPGEHLLKGQVLLDRAVTVKGAGMDVTIATRAPAAPKTRLFQLNHPGSVVEDLTVKKSLSYNNDGYGYGVWIGGLGGTLRRCRVTECRAGGSFEKGAVAIMGGAGLVTQCIIDKNSSLEYNGPCAGIYMSAGRLENPLIKENVASNEGGVVRNCTIVGNKTGKKGGGIYWNGWCNEPFAFQNLIVKDNIAPNDGGAGAPEWFCGRNEGNFKDKTTHCLFGNGKSAGKDPVIGDPAFNDPANGDYSLGLGSAAIDKGLAYDGIETAFDLMGVKRLSGAAVDVGCCEFNWDAPRCGFAIDPAEFLEGGTVTLAATVSGAPDPSALVYDWTLTSLDGKHVEKFDGSQASGVIASAGHYEVTLFVTDKKGFEVTETRTNALHVAALDSYFAKPGDSTPAYPWKTPATASTNLIELVSEAIDGARIHLPAGEFALPDTVTIERGVRVTGAGMDQTVFVPAQGMGKRLFYLNNPSSIVERLTLKGAKTGGRDAHGIGIWIGALGGTFRYGRVTECQGNGPFQRGVVSLTSKDSVVSHCIIDHNRNSQQGSGGGLYMSGGRVENTLVYGNYAQWSGGGVSFSGGHLRNCTFATNSVGREASSVGGGLHTSVQAIGSGSVENCIFYGNVAPVDKSEGSPDWFAGVQWGMQIKSLLDKISSNCLFGTSATFGKNARTGDPLFKDPAAGDFTISRNSPAHDTGLYGEWMDGATDLAGNPRVDYKTFVDIGCYEATYVPAATILILR